MTTLSEAPMTQEHFERKATLHIHATRETLPDGEFWRATCDEAPMVVVYARSLAMAGRLLYLALADRVVL